MGAKTAQLMGIACLVIVLLLGMNSGMVVSAQGGDGDPHPVITRDNAAQLKLIGAFERGWIQALAWSSDGAYLAVAASNGAYIYDTANWDAPPQTLPSHGSAVVNLAWHAGAHELVTVHADGPLLRWALVDGVFEQVPDYDIDVYNGLFSLVRDRRNAFDPAAFTADGSIVVALGQHDGRLDFQLPCLDVAICIRNVTQHTNSPANPIAPGVHVLPDGTPLALERRVVTAANGQVAAGIPFDPYSPDYVPSSHVVMWDGAGNQTRTIETGFIMPQFAIGDTPNTIALNPAGTLLAAGGCTWLDEGLRFCQQSGVKLFDAASGQVVREFDQRFMSGITALAFSADGTHLAAADNRVVRVWDVATGEARALLTGYGATPHQLVAHPTQQALIAAHGTWKNGDAGAINIWDAGSLLTGDPIASLPGATPVAVSPDGHWLVAGNAGDHFYGEVTHPTLWNIANPAAPYAVTDMTDLTRTQRVDDVEFSPDGLFLVAIADVDFTRDGEVFQHRELRVFETKTFALLGAVPLSYADWFLFSPDGRWFVFDDGESLSLYPMAQLNEVETMLDQVPYLSVEGEWVEFPPGRDELLVFVRDGDDKEVQRWNLETGELLGVEGDRYFWDAIYSADGSLLVMGSSIYDAETNAQLWHFDLGFSARGATFSADGRYLYVRSGYTDYYNDPATNPDNTVWVFAVPQSPEEVYTPPQFPPPLVCQGQADVHVLDGDTLNVRANHGLEGEVLARLEAGTRVDIVENDYTGCIQYAESYVWLNIRTPDGIEGWAVMFADGLQTLTPVPAE